MTHVCVKCGTMIKCSKDKKKSMRLTSRVTARIKNCDNATQHKLKSA